LLLPDATTAAPAGFIYLPSFAHSYSVTQSAADLRQALAAAEALAWNWNPATRSLRTFEGWEPVQASKAYKQIVIIGEFVQQFVEQFVVGITTAHTMCTMHICSSASQQGPRADGWLW
jgi:hypothetical protein